MPRVANSVSPRVAVSAKPLACTRRMAAPKACSSVDRSAGFRSRGVRSGSALLKGTWNSEASGTRDARVQNSSHRCAPREPTSPLPSQACSAAQASAGSTLRAGLKVSPVAESPVTAIVVAGAQNIASAWSLKSSAVSARLLITIARTVSLVALLPARPSLPASRSCTSRCASRERKLIDAVPAGPRMSG